MWKDLLLNLVTNKILCRNTYFVVYNMLTKKMHKRIAKIQTRMEELSEILPQDLDVSKRLSLDLEYRREVMSENRTKLPKPFLPYARTIESLERLRGIESLILKLEFVYRLFTRVLTAELSEFWEDDNYFKQEDLFIDADSLKGIIIYIIIQTKSAKMLMDISKLLNNLFI